MTTTTILPLYTQLLGVGLLWTTFHCAGMCGPLMAGLVAHQARSEPGETRSQAMWRRAHGVLAYQMGRGVTYALLGALAGWLGASFQDGARSLTQSATLVSAALILGIALAKLFTARYPMKGVAGWAASGRWLGKLMRHVAHIAPRRGPARMSLFGIIMGWLPCMLMFWVMSLAVASSSPLHGALMMLILVAMTTPVLLAAGCSTALLTASWRARLGGAVPYALILTALWTFLIGAAANGWIPHVHLPFSIGQERYTIMLF